MIRPSLRPIHTRLALALAMLIVGACLCTPGLPGANSPLTPVPPTTSPDIDTHATLHLAGSEEVTLDPAKWQGGPDGIVGDMFSGLVRLGVTLRPIPDLTESWDITQGGSVYTFHLRHGVKFHDGRAFTADDVQYSWDRAVSPATGSHTAITYLNDIAGALDVASGKATSISGVKVIDPYTLQVTLDSPKIYFLDKLSYPAGWIVDKNTIDQIETHPNGTGPYAFVEHKKNQDYTLKRDPDYYLAAPAIENIDVLVYADLPTRLYEAGQIDLVTIGQDLVPRAQDPADPLYGNVQAVTGFCTNYVSFDVAQKPFDDPLVRKAFVEAIDKNHFDDVILNGTGILAEGLYPPGLPGYNTELTPLSFNASNATRDLAGSSYGGAQGLPPITYTTFGSGGSISAWDGLLIQMWKDTLGVTITPQGLDYDSFYDAIYAGKNGPLISSGWCADYPDPESFADLFESHSLQNRGHYHNPDVDALLAQARVATDSTARMRLYQQVEQHLVDDAAGLFLTHSQAYYVVTKPYLDGYVGVPIGVAQTMNLSIHPH